MTTDTPALVDALPYIDTTIDDDDTQREMAMKMVDDEMMDCPPEKAYLDYLADTSARPFLTDTLQNELQALENPDGSERPVRERLSRVDIDIPPPANSNMDEEETRVWTKCLNQIKIKLEYLQRQTTNLDLLKTYGVPAWEQYIADNERLELGMKQEIEELDGKMQEVNSLRKSHQAGVARHLDVLQTHWDNLSVSNRLLAEEIERVRAQIRDGTTPSRNSVLQTT